MHTHTRTCTHAHAHTHTLSYDPCSPEPIHGRPLRLLLRCSPSSAAGCSSCCQLPAPLPAAAGGGPGSGRGCHAVAAHGCCAPCVWREHAPACSAARAAGEGGLGGLCRAGRGWEAEVFVVGEGLCLAVLFCCRGQRQWGWRALSPLIPTCLPALAALPASRAPSAPPTRTLYQRRCTGTAVA